MKRFQLLALGLAGIITATTIGCDFDTDERQNLNYNTVPSIDIDIDIDMPDISIPDINIPDVDVGNVVSSDNKIDFKAIDLYGDYSIIELETVKKHVTKLQDDVEISDNEEQIKKDIQILLDDLDCIAETLSQINILYYKDWYNEELEDDYDKCYETYYVIYEFLNYAFYNCYNIEEYSHLFEPYVDLEYPEYMEYYTANRMTLGRIERYAMLDSEMTAIRLDNYYNIVYDTKKKKSERNLETAELYLDLLRSYDINTFYDTYDRDFSGEDILEMTDSVTDYIMLSMERLDKKIYDSPMLDAIYDDPITFENPFEVIEEYAENISAEIYESAVFLNDNSLYCIATGDESYEGSFTMSFPLHKSSAIYLYTYDDYYDIMTAIHEFGHLHASLYDDTTTFLTRSNMDIAEIQSQGMEVIFSSSFDEIYGEQAEMIDMLQLSNLMSTVVSSFLIGEFEYTVLKNIDTWTAEDVVECFENLMDKGGYNVQLYEIPHIFEMPGYYISYGTSALATLDLWSVSIEDYDKSLEMYQNIAEIKSGSGEYKFKEALKECGFNDVLNEDYIIELSLKIDNYVDELD